MLNLLRHRPEFRRVFLAHTVSRAGDAFNTVALVVLVFQLTGSGRGVATTVAFEVAPVLLFGPAVGVIADRLPRRRVMIVADLIRAGLVAGLAVSHTAAATAFAVAFALSTASLLFNPAAASLVPEVVDDDELVAANSALWTSAVASQILLAPMAGVVVAYFGVGVAFALNAASYVLSAAFLAGLRAGRNPAQVPVAGWRSVREGVATVRSHPLLARLAVVQVLASLSAGATSGLLVVLAADSLGIGPSGFGVLLAAIGVGAVAGPALLRRRIRPSAPLWLFGPYAVRGVVDLVLDHAQSRGGGWFARGLRHEHLDGDGGLSGHVADRSPRPPPGPRLRLVRRVVERSPVGVARTRRTGRRRRRHPRRLRHGRSPSPGGRRGRGDESTAASVVGAGSSS